MSGTKIFRFAFVSNSEQIASTVKAFEDSAREHIEIRLASMEEALPVARDCLANGVEVVLGGGATGRLLREQLKLPVITIARRDLDVIRALMQARQRSRKIGLTSFGGLTSGVNLMAEILEVDIKLVEFRTTPDLVSGISMAVKDGYQCIVGGDICKKITESVGAEGFVVVPGDGVIQQALAEARIIAATQRRNQKEAERLRVILHSVNEGIVGIDSRGRIDLINPVAAEMLDLEIEQVLHKPMPEIVRSAGLSAVLESGMAEVDRFQRLDDVDMVVSAMPVNVSEDTKAVVATFTRVSRIQDLDRKLKERLYTKGFVARYTLGDLKGSGETITRLRDKAFQYATTDATILIQGETGTGKEILAQGIHQASPRRGKPFVAVNCSALPESLLDSELFGYEDGAFTGAKRGGKQGLFELAAGGTLFLDELADITSSLQVRLLRVIEEKEIMRLGGDRIIPVDVRIITSTYKNLALEVKTGQFRADLYFRIVTLKLNSIPLRERIEDIPLLLESLLTRYHVPRKLSPLPLFSKVMSRMASHNWPGNVRELDSLVRRYVVLAGAADIDGQSLLLEIMEELAEETMPTGTEKPILQTGDRQHSLKKLLREREQDIIAETLRRTGDNKAEAARQMGISVNSLWRKLRED